MVTVGRKNTVLTGRKPQHIGFQMLLNCIALRPTYDDANTHSVRLVCTAELMLAVLATVALVTFMLVSSKKGR